MLLGIEIGGTKIQLAVGRGGGSKFVEHTRFTVDPKQGASGILSGIEQRARPLLAAHRISAVGIGFGGPVDTAAGRVITSHHIDGWRDFPLADWCARELALPATIANDADTAGLAEAHFGAGDGRNPLLYITIGTGIGGGLIIGGEIFHGAGQAAAEIGHLRPGPEAEGPHDTVEAKASGWGIAAATRQRLIAAGTEEELVPGVGEPWHGEPPLSADCDCGLNRPDVDDLMARCQGHPERLTTKTIGEAAAEGNRFARHVLFDAWRTLGWGIAQAITLVSPEVVVIGGGVSLLGEALCLDPLRAQVRRYVFPPLIDSYRLLPATLGEDVVLHGALLLAAKTRG